MSTFYPTEAYTSLHSQALAPDGIREKDRLHCEGPGALSNQGFFIAEPTVLNIAMFCFYPRIFLRKQNGCVPTMRKHFRSFFSQLNLKPIFGRENNQVSRSRRLKIRSGRIAFSKRTGCIMCLESKSAVGGMAAEAAAWDR